MDYTDYYIQCQRMFPGDKPKLNLKDLGVLIISPTNNDNEGVLKLPPDYLKLVDSLAAKINYKFQDEKNCYLQKGVSPEDDLALRLKDPFQLSEIHDLANLILPQIETSIFGSYVHVMHTLIYRNNVIENPKLRSSWKWHYDNHPNEVIKIMIYLNDVDENTAPLEYLVDAEDNFVKIQPSRTGPENWFGKPKWPESRVPDSVLNEYLEKGYKTKKVTGQKGTVLIFSQNILHRANVAKINPRNVAVFQLKPYKTKLSPYIHQKWTGSFQHRPTLVNPLTIKPIKKESLAVTLGKLKSRFLKQ